MTNNYIFIDESGNMKNKNTLVICLVVFNSLYKSKESEININNFKLKYFKDVSVELHFNKENAQVKRKFFTIFNKSDFLLRYSVILGDKDLSEYHYVIQSIVEHKDLINNSSIFIDGFKLRTYNRKIISKIKKELKSYNINIKSIKYIDSKNSNLIQLADMCAGCIRRKIERETKEDNELFDIIKKFIK